jgi:hypothetical protein
VHAVDELHRICKLALLGELVGEPKGAEKDKLGGLAYSIPVGVPPVPTFTTTFTFFRVDALLPS